MHNSISRRRMLMGAAALCSVGSIARADDLIDSAKKEGALAWYTSDTSNVAQAIAKAFREAYGITVEVNRKTTLPLVEQFATESARGTSPADVITVLGMGPAAGTLMEKNLLASYTPAGADKLPAQYRVGDKVYAYSAAPIGTMYNTRLLAEADVPLLRSYKKWLDPKLKNKMAIVAPTGGTSAGNMLMLQQREGKDFLKAITTTQKVTVYQTHDATADAVAAGEQAVGLSVTPSIIQLATRGAPVRFVFQDEWTFVAPAATGISAKAPHPNAARLFLNWMLTPETQKRHADISYWVPVIPGVKPSYPGAEWLELPKNPAVAANPVAFDQEIASNIADWRAMLGW